MSDETKKKLENDTRFITQTAQWQRRFIKLNGKSSDIEWHWIISHYKGDQDDLDHIINEYNKNDDPEESA